MCFNDKFLQHTIKYNVTVKTSIYYSITNARYYLSCITFSESLVSNSLRSRRSLKIIPEPKVFFNKINYILLDSKRAILSLTKLRSWAFIKLPSPPSTLVLCHSILRLVSPYKSFTWVSINNTLCTQYIDTYTYVYIKYLSALTLNIHSIIPYTNEKTCYVILIALSLSTTKWIA